MMQAQQRRDLALEGKEGLGCREGRVAGGLWVLGSWCKGAGLGLESLGQLQTNRNKGGVWPEGCGGERPLVEEGRQQDQAPNKRDRMQRKAIWARTWTGIPISGPPQLDSG